MRVPVLTQLLDLFFPEFCAGCDTMLVQGESCICTTCLNSLPFTNFFSTSDQAVAKQFWGRIKPLHAGALLYFHKGGKVQKLIHALKYLNQPQIGVRLGNIIGEKLLQNDSILPDLIVPVPLHPKKLYLRGYNQSACIAEGIAEVTGKCLERKLLIKNMSTESQTHKNRFQRHENLRTSFIVAEGINIKEKHVLLVDDVITTGATLETCFTLLVEKTACRVSFAALAFTE